MKKFMLCTSPLKFAVCLVAAAYFAGAVVYAEEASEVSATVTIDAKSSLLMEAETGKILSEFNAHEKLAPASVTKVMTMLLIYEALEQERVKWDDVVTISAHAASMGGSQIFLEQEEKQTVRDLTKSIVME